jgi:MFS family permease
VPEALVPLRRNRDFLLFWSSQVVSTLGTRATAVALPLLVLGETGSPARAGLVGFAQTLPFLVLFLPAGVVVDRLDRKRLMLISEVVRFLAMGWIAASVVLVGFSLVVVVVAAFIAGSAAIFFELSESAALPHLVPAPQIPAAIAQNQARQEGADLVGQPLGGLLFSVRHALPFAFDAASYVVSFVALRYIRAEFQHAERPARQRLRTEIGEGAVFLVRHALLRTIVLLVGGWNFVSAGLVLVLIVRAQDLGASSTRVGLMLAAFSTGALLGAGIAPRAQRRLHGRTVVIGAIGVNAVAILVMSVATSVLALGVIAGLAAITGPPFNVVIGSYRYAFTPDHLQGRVLSAARVVAWGTIPVGSLLAGIALERYGTITTLRSLAGVMFGVAVATVAAPSVRKMAASPTPAGR